MTRSGGNIFVAGDMRRLADSILAEPGAWPTPEQTELYSQFLRGETTTDENRAVVLELIKRASQDVKGE